MTHVRTSGTALSESPTLSRALRPSGVIFVSFKLRDGEWEQDGLFFNGYNEDLFRQLIEIHPSLLVKSIWLSDDARPERKDEKWLKASATSHHIATPL